MILVASSSDELNLFFLGQRTTSGSAPQTRSRLGPAAKGLSAVSPSTFLTVTEAMRRFPEAAFFLANPVAPEKKDWRVDRARVPSEERGSSKGSASSLAERTVMN